MQNFSRINFNRLILNQFGYGFWFFGGLDEEEASILGCCYCFNILVWFFGENLRKIQKNEEFLYSPFTPLLFDLSPFISLNYFTVFLLLSIFSTDFPLPLIFFLISPRYSLLVHHYFFYSWLYNKAIVVPLLPYFSCVCRYIIW